MAISELLELAVAHAPCAVFVFDGEGAVLFTNPAFDRMFGYTAKDLRGTNVEALAAGLLAAGRSERSALARDVEPQPDAPPSLPFQGRRKDATTFPIDVRLVRTVLAGRPVTLSWIVDATERQQLHKELVDRTVFEQAVSEIAASFVSVTEWGVGDRIAESHRRLSELLGVERSAVWQRDDEDFAHTSVWTIESQTPPTPPPPKLLAATTHFPWVMSRMEAGEIVSFARVEDLPSEPDRESYRRIGTRSGVVLPLVVEGRLVGMLSFAMLSCERAWSAYFIERLPLIAAVFSSSLARRMAREALDSAYTEIQTLKDRLAVENVHLRREVRTLKEPRVLALESAASRHVLEQIQQVAPTTATVLMLGETGSGKEAFAEALHDLSPRHGRPMIRVNCGAIPTALIESELFGRERGAYTGALSRQLGRFELADGSTIFLDEIGDLPLDVQVKLLRVLQDRVIERLGSPQSIKINVRIIAATNKDLDQAVADRTFREDLFYRLNVFPIRVPPLRERPEDLPSLVWSFISEFSTAFGKDITSLSKASLRALQAYDWPGNIRELRNVVERAVIISNGPVLVVDPPRGKASARRPSLKFIDVEVEHIRGVLESAGWRIRGRGGAADLLGMKPTTLESRMAKLGIARPGS